MSGLNSTYDDSPEHYDELRHCWLNDRREAFLVACLEASGTVGPQKILEIGSGTGWLLARLAQRFPDWSFCGIEPIQAYLDFASSQYDFDNLSYSQGSAEAPPADLVPETFDLILSNDVLHHVRSEEQAIGQATRLARPGARWISIEPNALNPYAFAGQAIKSGERNFWPGRFAEQARTHGWHLDRRDYLFLIPPFIKRPPRWMKDLEQRLERVPVLGGGIVLELRLDQGEQRSALSAAGG
jgi:SAM-dependent methyltransferase